ncbi:twin-arginine translocase TatA/TatE family subunit [Janibacter melonis]|uniref:twin-arginine translocase TatA/TatE family subunit n=1 Tax=Janibacter melonis TaxID=262209 RepID=UPI00204336B1|nr:twin-arginine translocase TatA/TatE family subunit [Janibacter melonis]MCM3555161.1 twin-arginine translocase TatA/TatE family subunit [Janibacter melonis]
MPMNGWEFIILIVLAVVILGPDRLPEYAQKLARFVVGARRMANDARGQLQDQLGPEYEDIDWRQYDPRQYDPRRIVREALLEPIEDSVRDVREIGSSTRADIDGLSRRRRGRDEDVRHDDPAPEPVEGTPYDLEAT